MECEYCKKTYSTNSSLFHHQRTVKSCLKIQETQGVIKKEKDFICIYCKNEFTSKYNMETHHGSCKSKIKEDALQLTKKQIEESEDKIKNELSIKDDKIKELQERLNRYEQDIPDTVINFISKTYKLSTLLKVLYKFIDDSRNNYIKDNGTFCEQTDIYDVDPTEVTLIFSYSKERK